MTFIDDLTRNKASTTPGGLGCRPGHYLTGFRLTFFIISHGQRNMSHESTSRYRRWSFTLREETTTAGNNRPALTHRMRALVYQLESGGNSGYRHFQGYVEYHRERAFSAVKKDFGVAVHIEPAIGSRGDNYKYCTKEETRVDGPWEFGDWTDKEAGQGRRSDLHDAKERLDAGSTMADVARGCFTSFVRNTRGLTAYRALTSGKRKWVPHVFFLWGDTGVGKSRWAYDRDPGAYWKPPASLWWDFYDGERTVVLDDLRDTDVSLSTLLRWLDRYPLLLPVKGAHTQFLAREIIITTNVPLEKWYGGKDGLPLPELERRMSHVIEVKKDGKVSYSPCPQCISCISVNDLESLLDQDAIIL